MLKKLLFLVLALVYLCGSAYADSDGYNTINVNMTDGTIISYTLGDQPAIICDDEFFIVRHENGEVSIGNWEVESFSYTYSTNGINSVQSDKESRILIDGNQLTAIAKSNGAHLLISNVEGKVLTEKILTSTTPFVYDFNSHQNGVYVITLDGVTVKFLKK